MQVPLNLYWHFYKMSDPAASNSGFGFAPAAPELPTSSGFGESGDWAELWVPMVVFAHLFAVWWLLRAWLLVRPGAASKLHKWTTFLGLRKLLGGLFGKDVSKAMHSSGSNNSTSLGGARSGAFSHAGPGGVEGPSHVGSQLQQHPAQAAGRRRRLYADTRPTTAATAEPAGPSGTPSRESAAAGAESAHTGMAMMSSAAAVNARGSALAAAGSVAGSGRGVAKAPGQHKRVVVTIPQQQQFQQQPTVKGPRDGTAACSTSGTGSSGTSSTPQGTNGDMEEAHPRAWVVRRASSMVRRMHLEWRDLGCTYRTQHGDKTVLQVWYFSLLDVEVAWVGMRHGAGKGPGVDVVPHTPSAWFCQLRHSCS